MQARWFALILIRAYQLWISPYKGFCCAYRVHTGRASCSAFGFRAVRRYGVFGGSSLIRQRTYLCGVAHRRYSTHASHRAQRGFVDCDLPCSSDCDTSCLDGACEVAECADCDWPAFSSRKKKRSMREKYGQEAEVHLPPKTGQQPESD